MVNYNSNSRSDPVNEAILTSTGSNEKKVYYIVLIIQTDPTPCP